MPSRSRTLVFGGTGRIGPQLVELLQENTNVTLFDRRGDQTLPPPHQALECDLRDADSIASAVGASLATGRDQRDGPLGVLYMATGGLNAEEATRVDAEFEISTVGLNAVVQAVARHWPAPGRVAVVFASSQAVLTFPSAGLGYGVGKAAGEQYCRHMAHNPPTDGWRFNVIRIGRVSVAPELVGAVARLAEFLLHDSSRGISGQVFTASSPWSS